ncbi:cytochrome b-c1 complex subunit 6, mitochondrial [Ceratitis capitata]|uniref:cytochrome b-c1 complex subunit 6, mitochondrial n=1 Tax=Ceratitis capitata TaxID=7213 RepID=UPI000329AEC9|nr:cytochrome b-c1 complex subunit 6, mitochondrial [Ceratitis capitata]XP_012156597.1 cytochrome b-c1 complex subunit 6, mitochondrial [Ceratitis capitata]
MALFKFFATTFFPTVRAEDEEAELVDPQSALREKCQSNGNIQALYSKYQECNDRVNGKSKTTETCMEELFDYVTELDHCASHHLFSKLK